MHKPEHHRHFDEGADHCGESLSGAYPEHRDGHGDGELEVVARGGERKRDRFLVIGTHFFTQEETDEEHGDKVNEERNRDAHHVHGQREDSFSFEVEHDEDRKEKRDERERRDLREIGFAVPLFAFACADEEPGEEPCRKGNSEVNADASGNLSDADVHRTPGNAE